MPLDLREEYEEVLHGRLEAAGSGVSGRSIRLPALRADGSTGTVELILARIEHEPPLFVGLVRHLTATVDAEAALEAAETRYRSLVEQLPLVTYVNCIAERPA